MKLGKKIRPGVLPGFLMQLLLDTLSNRTYICNMKVEFVSFNVFNKIWGDLGLSDDDLKDLQEYLIINPETGSVIQGTGGVRKIRWALKNRGKSGGIRILYIDFIMYEKIYLLTAYPKNQKDNISDKEKKIIKQLVTDLKNELRRKKDEKKL